MASPSESPSTSPSESPSISPSVSISPSSSASPSASPSEAPEEETLLVTEVGSATANSYATVEEADVYIASRFSTSERNDWVSLTTAAKEMRLMVAANLLSSLPFMGIRSSVRQALSWPRLFPRDTIYKKGIYGNQNFFETYEEVEAEAEENAVDPPDIPNSVKSAQIELAWQVVHKSILTIETGLASSDMQISHVSVGGGGGFSVTTKEVGSVAQTTSDYLGGKPLTSLSFIQALLAPYLTRVRWRSL